MLKLKHILTGGLFSLALAVAAQAQTPLKINITGSSAYRGATHTAISKILAAGYTFAYNGSGIGSANQAIFKGTVGGTSVVIKTSWTGSVAGVQAVSEGKTAKYLADTIDGSTGGDSIGDAGTSAELPDVAMSDTFQNATPFNNTILTERTVGVVPFKWVANNGAPANLTNITPQQVQFLFQNGTINLSLVTGATADRTVKIFAIGRDPDSGTRLTAFAETGVGVASSVVQYQPTISGSTVTSQIPWPQSTVNDIVFTEGNGGYNSGGLLATAMSKTTFAGIGGYYVTYLSTGDAGTAIGLGAKELQYNGVPYSLTALQEGQYTFWSYEHLMYKSTLADDKKAVAITLGDQIKNTDATVLVDSMKVRRLQDGGLVRQ